MTNTDLRLVFNIFLVLDVLSYGIFIFFVDYVEAIWSFAFILIFTIIGLIRDGIAPKQKRSHKNDTN